MALLETLDDFDANGKKGDWCFLNDDTYIAIRFGDDPFLESTVLPIKPVADKAFWNWDGNKNAPTLSPSILVWGNGRNNPATWHGYLRNGKLETI